MSKSKRLDILNNDTDFRELVELVKKELEGDYKRGFIKDLDVFSVLGYGFNNHYNKLIYVNSYRYRKDIKRGLIKHIRDMYKVFNDYDKSKRDLDKRVGK